MTAPSNANTSGLAPCPFCGNEMTIRKGVNAYGYCATDGCWVKERLFVVPLDDPRQVNGWNRRVATAAEARADRLAKALEALEAERKREGVTLAHLKRAVAVAYADMNRAAQETQP